jgi:hypothetical protein
MTSMKKSLTIIPTKIDINDIRRRSIKGVRSFLNIFFGITPCYTVRLAPTDIRRDISANPVCGDYRVLFEQIIWYGQCEGLDFFVCPQPRFNGSDCLIFRETESRYPRSRGIFRAAHCANHSNGSMSDEPKRKVIGLMRLYQKMIAIGGKLFDDLIGRFLMNRSPSKKHFSHYIK